MSKKCLSDIAITQNMSQKHFADERKKIRQKIQNPYPLGEIVPFVKFLRGMEVKKHHRYQQFFEFFAFLTCSSSS